MVEFRRVSDASDHFYIGNFSNVLATRKTMNRKEDYDSYEIEEPSDEDRASSSEDELDVLLNGTPDQKKKLLREYLTGESESSSGDEFEKEMEAELNCTMKSIEGNWAAPTAPAGETSGVNGSTSTTGEPQVLLYDNIYFDSDSDEECNAGSSRGQRKKQRTVQSNDELLYDPDEDDRDQAWVDARRKEYRNSRKRPASSVDKRGRSQALPSSDAVLNCPACMTTLCLDCQRHEKYRTQYRAMFVMNCTVNKEEVLRYKTENSKKMNRRRKKGRQEPVSTETKMTDSRLGGMDEDETYHPVQCTECSTEVAVFDEDEVYHFFNILASHS